MRKTLAEKQKEMRERGTVYDDRHRNKQKPTAARTDAEYWEAELQRAGFTMRRGESPRLLYWGEADKVGDIVTRLRIERKEGRVKPKAQMQ
jgi:hypothetical protein